MRCDKDSLLLYAVTDRSWVKHDTLYEQVEAALKGGVTFLQLREKEMNNGAFLQEVKEIKELCASYQVPFVVNDDVEIAKKVDADGVHVGQDDMPVWKVREILGEEKIIGVSAQTVEQAIQAEKEGADYLGVGAVFPTSSKADAVEVERTMLCDICAAVKIPVVAIGGICAENMEQLSESGIAGIAVISAIFAQDDRKKAAEELKKRIEAIV